jgi:hypothetical protein
MDSLVGFFKKNEKMALGVSLAALGAYLLMRKKVVVIEE